MSAFRHNVLINGSFDHTFSTTKVKEFRKIKTSEITNIENYGEKGRVENLFIFFRRNSPQWGRTSSITRFLDHTQQRITVGRTSLDELSDRRRDLYLTTHNTHNKQTSMPAVGFEPKISAGERPHTYALVRAATGTGSVFIGG